MNQFTQNQFTSKSQLIRKKSGEIIKPALRHASQSHRMASKASPIKVVHFKDDLEQVQQFFQVDEPISIKMRLPSAKDDIIMFEVPFNSNCSLRPSKDFNSNLSAVNIDKASGNPRQPVQLVRLQLSKDCQSIIGTVIVANIAYEKRVTVRFTVDSWKTISEASAEYRNIQTELSLNGYDLFQFAIELPDQAVLQSKILLLCVRYQVNGQEYWENNSGRNFKIIFGVKMPQGLQTAPREGQHEYESARLTNRHNFHRSAQTISTSATKHTALKKSYYKNLEQKNSNPSTSMIQNWQSPNFNQQGYDELIKKFYHFESSRAMSSSDQISHITDFKNIISQQASFGAILTIPFTDCCR